MTLRATQMLADRVLARLLENDPYRDSILGDLYEGIAERAHESELAARRWHTQQVLRSAMALLPSAAVRERNAIAGVAFGAIFYGVCVKASSFLAAKVSGRLPSGHVMVLWPAYLGVIVAAGLLAGFILGRAGRLPISSSLLFFALALGAGAHHIVGSHSSELAFRSTKVLLFIIASLLGTTCGISSLADALCISSFADPDSAG